MFPLKQIAAGILLCFYTFDASAQQEAPAASVYAAQTLTVYPQVSVNGSVSDGLYPFMQEGSRLFVQRMTLAGLGIRVPAQNLPAPRRASAAGQDAAETAQAEAVQTPAQAEAAQPEGAVLSDGMKQDEAQDAAAPAAAVQKPAAHGAAGVSDGMKQDEAIDTAAPAEADMPSENMPSENMPSENMPSENAAVWYDLAAVAGLESRYDSAAQTLALVAPVEWLDRPLTRLGGTEGEAYQTARAAFAGVFNYDYNHTRYANGGSAQGLLAEARLTTPAGYLSHNHLWNGNRRADGGGSSQTVRLDTYWKSVWAEKGLAFSAGDVVSGFGGAAGAVRLGGFKLEKSYGFQPWRNTAPLRSFAGTAALPSAVDLYIDGAKQYSGKVAAGDYEILLPPTVSGSGIAQIVATDLIGRTVVVDMPLYGGSGLLGKGLNEWSVEAGYLRRGYGIEDFSYGRDLVGSASLRYGISNSLTARVHAEGGGGYRRFGAAATTLLGSLGQLDLSRSQSYFQGKSGSADSAFFNTRRKGWSFGTGFSRSSAHYTGMDAVSHPEHREEGQEHRSASVFAGWSGERAGSFNLSYVYSRSGSEKADKIATLNWNRNLGRRASLSLSAAGNLNGSRERSIYGSLSFSLDKGYSLGLSAYSDTQGGGSGRIGLHKSGGGLNKPSWSANWERRHSDGRGSNRFDGHFRVDTQYGDLHTALNRSSGGSGHYSAGWRGSLVLMKGGLFASRTVDGSFAVVDTGIAGLPVTLSNNPVGTTNRRGLLLVPKLLAHQKNQIGLDITGLPYDIRVGNSKIHAVPSEKSGVAVDFDISRMQAASLTLSTPAGRHIESGSVIRSSSGAPVAVVGFDGQTFIEDMQNGRNRFSVERAENAGICVFEADYRAQASDGLPDLGELVCTPEPSAQ